MNYPYGKCECTSNCQCSVEAGPAAYIVVRNGKKIKCCTRCNLSDDSIVNVLVSKHMPSSEFMKVFFEYDPLSIFTIREEITRLELSN